MRNTKQDFLTLTHYKEPLLAIPKKDGFGYFGALQVTTDGEKVQCHICGRLFVALSGHIWQKHKITIGEYKDEYQLSRTTSLISENERARRAERSREFFASMTKEEFKEMRRHAMREYHKFLKANPRHNKKKWNERLETKNKKGTCPDQLLAKIQEVAEQQGRTPTLAGFVEECGTQRYKHLIFKVFGSWNNALKKLGFVQNPPRKTYTDEQLLNSIVEFAELNGREPLTSDLNRKLLYDMKTYTRRFGTWRAAKRIALQR